MRLVVAAALLACACAAEPSVETTADERAAAYRLGLEAPVRVVHVSRYIDGGTTSFILQDRRSKPMEGCFDGRMDIDPPRHLYLGSLRPESRHARLAEFGSAEEQAAMLLIQVWIERVEQDLDEPGRAAAERQRHALFLGGALKHYQKTRSAHLPRA